MEWNIGIWVRACLHKDKVFKDTGFEESQKQHGGLSHIGNRGCNTQPVGNSTGWRVSFTSSQLSERLPGISCCFQGVPLFSASYFFFLIITFKESWCISHHALQFHLSPWSLCIHLCACNLPSTSNQIDENN